MLKMNMHWGIFMKSRTHTGLPRSRWAITALSLTLMFAGFGPLAAAEPAQAPEVVEQDAQARKIVLDMARFIAQVPAFSFTIRSGYDAIQPDGQSIEFGDYRRILIDRPNGMRVDRVRSDGEQGVMLFDGKTVTVFNQNDNVYSRQPLTGSVDDALVYLVKDLQVAFPLARLLHTGFPKMVEERFSEVRLVEESVLFDTVTNHLAIRTAEVDVQMWITQGDQPLLQRIIIVYKNAPGQPQFRAYLDDWTIAPLMEDDAFNFNPPEGAEQIPLVLRVPRTDLSAEPKGDLQ
jgi:hypothetical protein